MFWPAKASRVGFLATAVGVCRVVSGCVGDLPAVPSGGSEAGSNDDAAAVTSRDAGTPDATIDVGAPGADAGGSTTPDGAPDAMAAPSCEATYLRCGGACVPDDPRNCGACGHDCTNLANVGGTVTCVSGVCTFDASACRAGFSHCTANPDDGCETSIATASHCGACGNACGTTAPICSSSGSSSACVASCSASAPTLCGTTTCVNTTNDAQNCGGCGAPCTTSVAHAQAACVASQCGYQCTASYPNTCPGACVNFGNDTNNCGACGKACPVPTNGSATCSATGCGISCNPGFKACGTRCVDETLNGNCGGCGVSCAISCTNSACLKATAIAAGEGHTCALLSDGSVRCWGANNDGQLGFPTSQTYGGTPAAVTPQTVTGLTSGVKAIAAGDFTTCALMTDGTVKCWGLNTWGNVGTASSSSCGGASCVTAPVLVSGLSGPAVAIAVGYQHTCALISGGTVQCWGNNADGELGNGMLTSSSSPVPVMGLTNATAIVAGAFHACALRSDHTVVCWGDNGDDQLGTAQVVCQGSEACSTKPVQASGISNATAIAGDYIVNCVLAGGVAECWGALQWGLGDDADTAESYTPITVAHVSSPVSVAVGTQSVCAVSAGGTVSCLGAEPLGDGTTNSSSTAVQVANLNSATALALGLQHKCALVTNGAVSCWSDNGYGQLGNGTTTPSLEPTPVDW
jgi:alpha-tubulin suppressor-like RCC1 family protein